MKKSMDDKDFKQWLSEAADGFTMEPSKGAFDAIARQLPASHKKKKPYIWVMIPAAIMLCAGVWAISDLFTPAAQRTSQSEPVTMQSKAGGYIWSGSAASNAHTQTGSDLAGASQQDHTAGPEISGTGTHHSAGGSQSKETHTAHSYHTADSYTGSSSSPVSQVPAVISPEPNAVTLIKPRKNTVQIPTAISLETSLLDFNGTLELPGKPLTGIIAPGPFEATFKRPFRTRIQLTAHVMPFLTKNIFEVNTSYNNPGNYTSQQYVNDRKQEDVWQFGSTMGLNIDFNIVKGFNIGTGVSFTRIMTREYLKQSYYYYNQETVTDLDTLKFTTFTGNDTTVYTSNTYTEGKLRSDTLRQAVANSFEYVEVPLNLSYDLYIGRLAIRAEAGISLGFLTHARTLQQNAPGDLPVIVNALEQSHARRLLLHFNTSVQFGYLITPSWQVYAGPALKVGVSSMFNPDYPILQRPISFGVIGGFRYRF